MTFQKAFNDIFAEGLKEHGFKYYRKYGMHMRFVNNELIQYITYLSNPAYTKGNKAYTVFSGIISIYCSSISKDILKQFALGIYYYAYHFTNATDIAINGYEYNGSTMLNTIAKSLTDTKKIVIPVFDRVINLNSYIEYRKKIKPSAIAGAKDFADDSLSLIKADNHDDFQDILQQEIAILKKWQAEGKLGGNFEDAYNSIYDGIITSIVKSRDEVYNDSQLYARALETANFRKEENLAILYENGVI